ncbi:MAG: hypothetical protein HY819_20190 [Acidobacteria bacterium]|nr:hypothetical protein [Acidobacteriota bacterium]
MKKVFNLLMVLVASVIFFNGIAYADGKGKKVEISRDVVVNGVEVKKGKYMVKFNDETNEMSLWQDDKMVAKSSARKGLRKNKAIATEILTSKQNQNNLLRGIILAGEEETILINVNSDSINVAPQQ